MYTIKEAAEIMNLPASTIRYYDRQGLLLLVQRSESGYRSFSDADIGRLNMIECLKRTGMPRSGRDSGAVHRRGGCFRRGSITHIASHFADAVGKSAVS